MKKIMKTLIVGVCTMALLVGCGDGELSNDKITIKQYKGLEVEKVEADKVTDADVEMSIQSDFEVAGLLKTEEVKSADYQAKLGDTVTIDYVGKMDGVAFEGGTASDSKLKLGSNTFIGGFETGIVGHKIGETFDLDLSFPDPYPNNPDLAGKPVVFTVTIDAITAVVAPELTDEIVPKLMESAKTVEEYKAQTRKNLEEGNKAAAEQTLQGAVLEALLEQCTVENYPEDTVKSYADSYRAQYQGYETSMGMDVDEIVKMVYGMTPDEMAKTTIKNMYAMELIAEEEEITVSDKEYEEALEEEAASRGYDVKTFKSMIDEEAYKKVVLQNKVLEFLIDNCKQVEAKK